VTALYYHKRLTENHILSLKALPDPTEPKIHLSLYLPTKKKKNKLTEPKRTIKSHLAGQNDKLQKAT